MSKVSIIIPGRCEKYFQQTIDSCLDNAVEDIEVIAVVDGYTPDPPLVARDERVKIIQLEKSIGQRAGYNLGVRESTGKYLMKLDAHAMVSPGFDVELKSHCPPSAIVLPTMKRLNPHEWKVKNGKTWFMYIGLDLYTHYWKEYGRRKEADTEYPEVMTGQGSCWFISREWNDYIGLLDENVGSWGNVGIEISLRTWLCGGTQIVNKKAWQAHWFRRDDGGFTYPMDGRKVAKAHKYTRENYYFKDDAFEKQIRPFRWLIEKFAPVPQWEIYLADGYEVPRAIIYYTDHHLDEGLARACMKNLKKVAANIPIISVSQRPLNFGKNVCVGEKPRCNKSIYEQILVGLEAAKEGSVIYLCEHDVAYNSTHFVHVPEVKDRLDYNQNRYYWAPGQNEYLPARGKWPLSQLVAYREFLIEKVKESIAMENPTSEMYRCRTHRFNSEKPNIDIRHGMNFSKDGRWKKEYYAGKSNITIDNIGHWGSVRHFVKKLGWNKEDSNPSQIARLLRKHYDLKIFRPAPIRVTGFKRENDLPELFNMLGLKKGAEIGVDQGHFSEVLCKNINDIDLMSIDSWAKKTSKASYEIAVEVLSNYNVKIIKEPSVTASLSVPDNSLDFVYIDANHTFDHCMEDLIMWSRKVKKGGIISGHDYDRSHRKGVVPAVDVYTKYHNVFEWFLTDDKYSSFFWVKE